MQRFNFHMKITQHQETNYAAPRRAELRLNFATFDKHHPAAFYRDNDTIPGENNSRLTLIYSITLVCVRRCRVRRLLLSVSYTTLIAGVESFSVFTMINTGKLVPLHLLVSIPHRLSMKGH